MDMSDIKASYSVRRQHSKTRILKGRDHSKFTLPLGERCLQVMVGSGLPAAMQVRLMLPPSLMEMSEEISIILGGTAGTRKGRKSAKELGKLLISEHSLGETTIH